MDTCKNQTASWERLHIEATNLYAKEPLLQDLIQSSILDADNIAQAMANLIAHKFSCSNMNKHDFRTLFDEHPLDEQRIIRDLDAVLKHDPAATDLVMPFLFFKGLHGLQAYRLAHQLWNAGRAHLAAFIQSRISSLCDMDIHPACHIGSGVMMDHATGIVIGATARVGDDVLFWHGVTLGGRGTENIDRHPKIRNGAIIGAGSLILGNIEIGEGAKIGAGSIVIKPVAAGDTVVPDTAHILNRV